MLQNPWIPTDPTPKQAAFLVDPHLEILFGGAAGGGKSWALLMAALQYVDRPAYRGLLLRRTYPELELAGGLIEMSQQWLAHTAARWSATHRTWTFPSGASLTFGALNEEADKYKYLGSAYHFVGYDELTRFTLSQFRYLHSRIRRGKGETIPLRMRATSNPGSIGHEWVRARFLDTTHPDRVFIPAGLADNPFLDADEYTRSLANLDPVTRAQLLRGDWTARADGGYFRREWMPIVEQAPAAGYRVRYWDLAATAPKAGSDPDWTAGALVRFTDGVYYLEDLRHVRTTPEGVEALIRQCAELDGKGVPLYIEQEPGASGKSVIDHYQRRVLPGWAVTGDKVTGPKVTRARAVSAAAEAGNLRLVRGAWIPAWLDEAEAFPQGSHDDQVDAVAGAVSKVTGSGWAVQEYYRRWQEGSPDDA